MPFFLSCVARISSTALLFLMMTHLGFASEDDRAAEAFFQTNIEPLLEASCHNCHGTRVQEGGLRLDSLEAVLRGGESGPALIVGQPEASLLIHAVRRDGLEMPPQDPLTAEQVAFLVQWVRDGAIWPGSDPASKGHNKAAPEPTLTAADRNFWSFRAVQRSPLPLLAEFPPARLPVDHFILARLRQNKMPFAPPASKSVLVRRLYFDLLGLLPAREEVQQFIDDPTPDALPRLADRLLASPHYGERWGRHWLDLARYADSGGFEFDFLRPYAYRYRDYVIDRFNQDQPYDKFIIEQLAGDEVAPQDFIARVATGFCRNGPTVGNQTLEKNRFDELDDVISTTSEVFLGLTLGCARCHDHKYDPLSQRDYYEVLAIFNSLGKRQHLMGNAEERQRWSDLDKQMRALRKQAGEIENHPSSGDWEILDGELVQRQNVPNVRLLLSDTSWTDYSAEVEVMKTGGTDSSFNYEASIGFIFRATKLNNFYWLRLGISDNREHSLAIDDHGGRTPLTRKIPGRLERDRWYHLRIRVQGTSLRAWIDQRLVFDIEHARHATGGIGFGNWLVTSRWRNLVVRDASGEVLLEGFPDLANTTSPEYVASPETVDVLNERIRSLKSEAALLPFAMSIVDEGREPRETRLHLRGDHRTPGPLVHPAVPDVLTVTPVAFEPAAESANTTGQRTTFAKWVASAQNPLTARVMANRIWQYHFGRGLVETPSNFGLNGMPPTHPALLDWLASEFVHGDWSVKHLHRRILHSATYQQSSQTTPQGTNPPSMLADPLTLDPENRLLWHFPKRRLEAELIRDRVLTAAGTLNRRMYGPGVQPRIHRSVIETSTTRKWPVIEQEGPSHWRRSIYILVRRSVLFPLLEAFDAPTTTQSCEKRLSTTVATQSLQMLNDAFTNEQAARMAADLLVEKMPDPSVLVEAVFWRCLARAPTRHEQTDCELFLQEQLAFHNTRRADTAPTPDTNAKTNAQAALADLCHVMMNLNEFIYID